jgi:hypothetical protein
MTEPTPLEQLSRLIAGYWVSQAIYVATKLGIADKLAGGPRSVEELAGATETHAPSLFRLLRALASIGIFREEGERRFALTPMAEGLRADAPESRRAMALMMGEEHYHAYGRLLDSIRTGRTAFEAVYGKPVFDYLAEHPDQAQIFDAAMTAIHGRETEAMLEVYDFSGVGFLADIGGGNGGTLLGVLGRYPQMRGLLFDLPGVIERARPVIEAAGLAARCQVVAGSFFESVPSGPDAFLLRHIIHDWDDEKAGLILRSIHRSMPEGGRLLMVESVIPPGNEPSFSKLLDLTMMVIPGGLERTEEEYRKLFEDAGFQLTRILPTSAEVSVIEGVKR